MLQIAYLFLSRKKIDGMLWLSFGIISIFGGLTIYLHSETFIKWKPTVLYWCFATGMLLSQLLFKRNIVRTMLGAQMTLPDSIWERVGFSWVAFFAGMGCLNLYVAFSFSTSTWVNFKLFGGSILVLVFVFAQAMYLSKYMEVEK
jgi:intracellular septation protein